MKQLFLYFFIFFIAAAISFKLSQTPKDIHYHAGFLIYIDGQLQDLAKLEYMDISPCNAQNKPTKENPQLEKAHLHDLVGDVVHVEHVGSTWQDLFTNTKFPIPANLPIVGYINGQTIPNILSLPIKPNDSVIIAFGNTQSIDTAHYVPLDHIKEVESKSETCDSNP